MAPIIEVKGLKKYFPTPRGILHAVDDVTLSIERGKTLGVVGESGCGKSTLGRTIIHLHESTGGKILLDGKDITSVRGKELRAVRERMQIIFQDPYSSLDPRKSIDAIIREPLVVSKRYKKNEIDDVTSELMDFVGIDSRLRMAYPHELDGGRRQRVGIARALALNPDFIVCDEPVSALDVSIQAQVLNLLKKLQQQKGLTYMFVTHDMSVVRHISDEICVMYLGQVVEKCDSKECLRTRFIHIPRHCFRQFHRLIFIIQIREKFFMEKLLLRSIRNLDAVLHHAVRLQQKHVSSRRNRKRYQRAILYRVVVCMN